MKKILLLMSLISGFTFCMEQASDQQEVKTNYAIIQNSGDKKLDGRLAVIEGLAEKVLGDIGKGTLDFLREISPGAIYYYAQVEGEATLLKEEWLEFISRKKAEEHLIANGIAIREIVES